MQTTPLSETRYVVLNSSGNGSVFAGPVSAREVWNPQNVHVQVTGPVTNEATCTIYVGDVAQQQNYRDSTFSGSSGDSTDRVNADTIKSGHGVWAVWSGGDAGRQATMNVTGSKTV
jgi:hypothetical protein